MAKTQFRDMTAAMKMRDTIERISTSVVNRLRPDTFLANVVDYDMIKRKAWVRTAGMAADDPLIEVQFTAAMQPNTSGSGTPNGFGTIVEVEGRPGAYWIKRIHSGEWRSQFGRLINARFNGGDFDAYERESQHTVTSLILPAVGNTVFLGSWSNEGFTLWSQGIAQAKIRINHELFVNHIKTYDVLLTNVDTAGTWRTLAPQSDSGSFNGNDFSLEIRIDGNKGFSLRIRRLKAGVFGTGSYYADIRILGQLFYMDRSNFNLEQSEPRPTEWYGRAEYQADENQAGLVNTGPYASGVKHLVEVRSQHNLLPPDSYTWDGSNFQWSGSWRIAGLGVGDLSSGFGRLMIGMPAQGVVIPVHGSSSASSVTVGGSGINMMTPGPSYTALYYEPKHLTDGSSDTSRFHLVGQDNPFKVPSHWILLALCNVSGNPGNSLMLGNGTWIDHWRTPGFANNWGHASGFEPFGYRKIGEMVECKSVIQGGTTSANPFAFPAGFRPTNRQIFGAINGGQASCRVDVLATGSVVLTGVTNNSYVTMQTIKFAAALA